DLEVTNCDLQWRRNGTAPTSCRFTPTRSEYARQALLKHGPVKGLWLAT
ncbi:MAG: membrane protein insertion efficiency factor YidD, partial [Prevotella sp.]|nr:membrane protein insertion efficiency factor YidD [Prevotella sp.]